ncbi:MAG: diguanylate cyclase (GGDEF)-like protein [Planctomycetota bacterium]|jgi:diguanylate cyclase (GGDEF)-like protein
MPTVFQDTLPSALENAENLPSLPEVALNIIKLSEDQNAELEDYANVIAMDPALAVQILKLANSSLYNLGQEIRTLERATMMLGTKTVQLMALSFSLVGQIPTESSGSVFNYSEYWKRSLSTAVAGRELGRLLGVTLAEEAFLCGLLSRLGQLVIAECMPEEYAEVIGTSTKLPTSEAESEILGFSHTDIGASLMKSWSLPEPLYLAVAYQTDPTQLPQESSKVSGELARIAHLAGLITSVLCDEVKGEALGKLQETAEAAGLNAEQVDTLILALESRIKETANLLEIELTDQVSHYEILDSARKQLVALSVETVRNYHTIARRVADDQTNGARQTGRLPSSEEETDEFTGMGNALYLQTCLHHEIRRRSQARLDQTHGSLGMLMIEIADFDAIIEEFGSQFAEQAINVVGQTLRGISRASDSPARYRNHVFALLAPSADTAAFRAIAGRMNETISEMPIVAGQEHFRIQTVIGVCTLAECSTIEDGNRMLKLTKQALAKAKLRGPGESEFISK